MRRLLFTIFGLILSVTIYAEVIDEFHYDASNGKDLVYNKTLNVYQCDYIAFNLPFASHFNVTGTHVEFTISKEDVEWYFFRNSDENYYDLHVNLYYYASSRPEALPICRGAIIRIVINRG